ncbi:hypothetical protein J40TS1_10870 [Paenibacillus montaniterrae]|uniref:Uncharacterized protein n=1 Tax=Paenibacillus montaniterrae TaxID=429341 RepID=A0A919YLK1_9BACL|nr:DUF6171 family protein [Paenibacillus montaniterrae]GIP15445.1 hypothetical protein J40TS1_10870 [Paenibacillus montaniterrae]
MNEESRNRTCRGCGPQYEVTEAQIDRILQAPMFQDETIVVPDHIYEQRLAACHGCEHLLQEQTCQLCGCYVRVSAKYRSKSCPNVKLRGWESYAN